LLRARFFLQHVREIKSQIAGRPRFLNHEEGGWRVNLADLVGMASYFPPEYLPVRPATTARTRHP
jgi:hypothetical protein